MCIFVYIKHSFWYIRIVIVIKERVMGGCITPVVKKQQKITKPDPGPKKPSK